MVKLLNIISFPYNLNFSFLWVKVLNKRDGHVWKVKTYKYEKWICSAVIVKLSILRDNGPMTISKKVETTHNSIPII